MNQQSTVRRLYVVAGGAAHPIDRLPPHLGLSSAAEWVLVAAVTPERALEFAQEIQVDPRRAPRLAGIRALAAQTLADWEARRDWDRVPTIPNVLEDAEDAGVWVFEDEDTPALDIS